MKKKYFALFVFILTALQLNAQGVKIQNIDKKKNQLFEIGITGTFGNASSVYDMNGDQHAEDTLYYEDDTTEAVYYPYTTEFKQQSYILNLAYLGIKNLRINTIFPFTNTSIEEKILIYDSSGYTPQISNRYTRNDASKFYAEGMNLDAQYTFDFAPIKANIFGGIFVPFYKYQATSDSTNDVINNKKIELGRAFEANIGAEISYDFSAINLSLLGAYNLRTEDFTNRMLYNFHFGISSIEDTELYANLKYVASIGEYKDAYKIDEWRSILYEKYLDASIGFKILFTDSFFVDLGYNIRITGRNTLAENFVKVNLGYIFTK